METKKRGSIAKDKKEKKPRHFKEKPVKIKVSNPWITVLKKYGRFNNDAKEKGWLKYPVPSQDNPFEVFDVSSGGIMRELSPLILGEVVDEWEDYLGKNIEDCWQGRKVWSMHLIRGSKFDPESPILWKKGPNLEDEINIESLEWLSEWQKWSDAICNSGEAKRHRVPKSQGTEENKNVPLFSYYKGQMFDYVPARKLMYCRWYAKLVQETNSFKYLKKRFDSGTPLILLDPDGEERDTFTNITKEYAQERIDDPDHVFGHGFVLACILLKIDVWSDQTLE
jgi:hypothetical protein